MPNKNPKCDNVQFYQNDNLIHKRDLKYEGNIFIIICVGSQIEN